MYTEATDATRRAREAILQRLGEALASATTREEVATALVTEGGAGLGAQTAAIWLTGEEPATLSIVAQRGYSAAMLEAFERVPVDSPLPIARCVRTREPLWFESRRSYEREFPAQESQTRSLSDARDMAFVCMPLVVDDVALGAFAFVFGVDRVFDDSDRHFVWMLARQCAQCIARAEAFTRERRARKLIEDLQSATAALSSAVSEQEIARALVDCAFHNFGADVAGVWILERERVNALYVRGLRDQLARYRSFPFALRVPINDTIRDGEPIVFTDEESYRRAYPDAVAEASEVGLTRGAMLSLPLRDETGTYGAVTFGFAESHALGADEMRTLHALAHQGQIALARSRAYERARHEETRFRTLVVASAQIVYTTDAQGSPQDSPSWCTFTGQSAERWLSGAGFQAIHEDERERVRVLWQSQVEGGESFEARYRLRRHDGVYVPVLSRATPVIDHEGRIREWIGTVTDISEQVRAEHARERSTERLALMQQITSELSRALTQEDVARHFLRRVREPFGAWTATLALSLEDGSLGVVAIGADPQAATWLESAQIAAASPLSEVVRENQPRWLLASQDLAGVRCTCGACAAMLALPLAAHGRVLGAFALCFRNERELDLEEQAHLLALAAQCGQALERARLYEVELRSNEQLRVLIEASARLSESLDYEHTLRLVVELVVPMFADFAFFDLVEGNDQVRRTALARDPKKQAILDASRWRPSRRADLNVSALSSGKLVVYKTIDAPLLRKMADSEEHLAVLRTLELCAMVSVPLERRGIVCGALTLCMGESKRSYLDRDVLTAVDLARRAALAVEQARLFAESCEGVRVRDEFLSLAGHELNTPLATLKLHLYGLRAAGDLSPKHQSRLDTAERQVERLTVLVAQLLDVSRVGAGGLTLLTEHFDLADVVKEEATRQEAERARVGSELRLDVESATGRWSRTRLQQVVSNLLRNAIKYGRGRPIHVRLLAQTDSVTLVVRDEGIGIAADRLARIFGRFERAVSRDYGGFGLGLWLCRQIIEASGGNIHVESTLGTGSVFTIVLPRKLGAVHTGEPET